MRRGVQDWGYPGKSFEPTERWTEVEAVSSEKGEKEANARSSLFS